ncbi:IS110 family transposase [Rhodococcus triatomae BKS 15-14]|nr:IS110 family transposase [Rhodococcus triatomae BKS 15-14]
MIGIDPHKSAHTATAVDPETNRDIGSVRIDRLRTRKSLLQEGGDRFAERLWFRKRQSSGDWLQSDRFP